MKDGLAAIRVRIYYYSISLLGKAFFACDLGGGKQQLTKQILLTGTGFIKRIDMLAGNY